MIIDFPKLASDLWPEVADKGEDDSDDDAEQDLSIEAQIANEVSAMKRPRKEQRFSMPSFRFRLPSC